MGIPGRGVALQARRALRLEVFNPLTGELIVDRTLHAGDRVTLPQGPGAYMCQGVFLTQSANGQHGGLERS